MLRLVEYFLRSAPQYTSIMVRQKSCQISVSITRQTAHRLINKREDTCYISTVQAIGFGYNPSPADIDNSNPTWQEWKQLNGLLHHEYLVLSLHIWFQCQLWWLIFHIDTLNNQCGALQNCFLTTEKLCRGWADNCGGNAICSATVYSQEAWYPGVTTNTTRISGVTVVHWHPPIKLADNNFLCVNNYHCDFKTASFTNSLGNRSGERNTRHVFFSCIFVRCLWWWVQAVLANIGSEQLIKEQIGFTFAWMGSKLTLEEDLQCGQHRTDKEHTIFFKLHLYHQCRWLTGQYHSCLLRWPLLYRRQWPIHDNHHTSL